MSIRFQIDRPFGASSDEEDDDIASDSGDEQRAVYDLNVLQEYDKDFNVKRWRRLKVSQQKQICAILQLTEKDETGKDTKKPLWTSNKHTAKSNRTLSVDRNHYLTCCRYKHTHTPHTHTPTPTPTHQRLYRF